MDVKGMDVEGMAESYREMGLLDRSEELSRRVLMENPLSCRAHFNLGCVHEERCAFGDAERHFSEARNLSPGDFEVTYKLGGVYLVQGKHERARECFERCLELDPGCARVRYNLGLICYSSGDHGGAARHFLASAELGGEGSDVWYMLGMSYYRLARMDEALEALKKAERLSPDHVEIHSSLAELSLQRFDFAAAERHYRKILLCDELNVRGMFGLARLHLLKGEVEPALEQLDKLVFLQPGKSSARALLEAVNGSRGLRSPGELLSGFCGSFPEQFSMSELEDLRHCVSGCLCLKVEEVFGGVGFGSCLDLGATGGLTGAGDGMYDFVLAADIGMFLGDLSLLFADVSSRMFDGGCFAFAIEDTEAADFVLSRTGVFGHRHEYVTELGGTHGFELLYCEECGCGRFCNVNVYIFRKLERG